MEMGLPIAYYSIVPSTYSHTNERNEREATCSLLVVLRYVDICCRIHFEWKGYLSLLFHRYSDIAQTNAMNARRHVP